MFNEESQIEFIEKETELEKLRWAIVNGGEWRGIKDKYRLVETLENNIAEREYWLIEHGTNYRDVWDKVIEGTKKRFIRYYRKGIIADNIFEMMQMPDSSWKEGLIDPDWVEQEERTEGE